MSAAGHRVLLLAVWCAVTGAAAQAAPPPPAGQSQSQAPPPDAPDEEFIEFLGADDVGDAAWWEFLKRAPPRAEDASATASPQDAKQ